MPPAFGLNRLFSSPCLKATHFPSDVAPRAGWCCHGALLAPSEAGDQAAQTKISQVSRPDAHGMRNEFALRSRTGVRTSFMALTCAPGSRAVPHTTAYDAVDDAFMTLPPYTRIKEGGEDKVHSRGRGVRNGSRSARSTPCPNQAGALSGKVQPLQPIRQLVAHPVGRSTSRYALPESVLAAMR